MRTLIVIAAIGLLFIVSGMAMGQCTGPNCQLPQYGGLVFTYMGPVRSVIRHRIVERPVVRAVVQRQPVRRVLRAPRHFFGYRVKVVHRF